MAGSIGKRSGNKCLAAVILIQARLEGQTRAGCAGSSGPAPVAPQESRVKANGKVWREQSCEGQGRALFPSH